ncbi:CheY-like chemotaxis protein [Constrictibacter sp. MBR-5]|jgi:CheY-like chemotaxis protein|uniref:response regulator transcription factor n=1 Tax=Constrictibacter sp. MBR-5 TaxID=3156467 RepID=UPI0033925E25
MTKILVVDDDQLTRMIAVHLLGRAGEIVAEACNGREALRMLMHDAEIGTLVTDVLMPEMDGLELIQAARKLRPRLRIVAMSAGGKRVKLDLLPVARSLGADACFQKPLCQETIGLVTGSA